MLRKASQSLRKQIQLTAQNNELAAHLADGLTIVFSKVGNRLEVRNQPASQPHQFEVALGFRLESSA